MFISPTRIADVVADSTIHDIAAPVLAVAATSTVWLEVGTYAAFGTLFVYKVGRIVAKWISKRSRRAYRELDDLYDRGLRDEAEAAKAQETPLAP